MATFNDPFQQMTPGGASGGSAPGAAPLPGLSSENPFTDALQHVGAFNAALNGQPYTPQSNAQNAKAPDVTGPTDKGGGTPATPPAAPPAAPPPAAPPAATGPRSPITNPIPTTQPPPPRSPITNPVPINSLPNPPANPDPGSIEADVWNQTVHFASYPGYEWLLQNPKQGAFYVAEYTRVATSMADHGQSNIVFADWLHGVDPSAPNPDYTKQAGYDTWKFGSKEDATAGITRDMRMGGEPMPGTPPAPPPSGNGNPPAPPVNPPAPPVVPPTPPAPPVTPPAPPVTPPVTPPNPGNAPGPVNTPDPSGPDTTHPTSDIQHLIDQFMHDSHVNQPDVESKLTPMFQRQQQLLQQRLQAEAVLTPGRLQSGGFGQNEGQALADLSGQQSAKLGDILQQQSANQMTQNTALTALATQAGMQKYVADINADLTRLQINTNSDLQKWLDDKDNALKKYGVDQNSVLERYKAELQKEGIIYSANAQVHSAELQRAATGAAAAAAAAAARDNAAMQFQLGTAGLNVDREKNIGQFILGLLGMGNMDINTINGILNGLGTGNVVVHP